MTVEKTWVVKVRYVGEEPIAKIYTRATAISSDLGSVSRCFISETDVFDYVRSLTQAEGGFQSIAAITIRAERCVDATL